MYIGLGVKLSLSPYRDNLVLKMFDDGILWRISGLKRETGENCLMKGFIIVPFAKYYYCD
jgi:hypothetical protein